MAGIGASLASTQNGSELQQAGAGKPLNDYLGGLPTTVFTVMTNLANDYKSINLGQVCPDQTWGGRLWLSGRVPEKTWGLLSFSACVGAD